VKGTPALWLDLAVKVSLVLLLAFGAFSGLERFAGKAFGWRLVGYSTAAVIVPVIWAAWSASPVSVRGRHAVRAPVSHRYSR
jgi:hypothetical protein